MTPKQPFEVSPQAILDAKVEQLATDYRRAHLRNKSRPWDWAGDSTDHADAIIMSEKLKYLAALHASKSAMEALGFQGVKEDFFIKSFVQEQIQINENAMRRSHNITLLVFLAFCVGYYLYRY